MKEYNEVYKKYVETGTVFTVGDDTFDLDTVSVDTMWDGDTMFIYLDGIMVAYDGGWDVKRNYEDDTLPEDINWDLVYAIPVEEETDFLADGHFMETMWELITDSTGYDEYLEAWEELAEEE